MSLASRSSFASSFTWGSRNHKQIHTIEEDVPSVDEIMSGGSESFVEVEDMVLGSSSPPVPNRVLHTFDGLSLDALPKLLLIDVWSHDRNRVLEALENIGAMCRSSDDDPIREQVAEKNRKIVIEVGGHLALVSIMRKWSDNREIQGEACFVLGAAGMDTGFSMSAVGVGALEAVLMAMTNFPDSEVVQLYGCGALLVISVDNKKTATYLVTELNALSTIIAAMQRFPDSTDIEDLACQIFLALSEWDELKVTVVKSGGIRALGAVIERYFTDDTETDDNKTVKEMALESLKRLLGL
jgi:hypothetical protein